MNLFAPIKTNEPFVLYRLPKRDKGYFLQAEQIHFIKEIKDISEATPGFVFTPFSKEKDTKTLFYEGNIQEFSLPNLTPKNNENYSLEKEINTQYKNTFKLFHQAVSDGLLQKVVLARSKKINIPTIDPEILFNLLASSYPDAFVYTLLTPNLELWFGATPELLLHKKGTHFETMALAGTMEAVKIKTQQQYWSEKNKKEQAIVVDYISQSLKNIGIETKSQPLIVKKAGHVAHLLTPLSFNTDKSLGEILNILHPTPAVCGFPKNDAFEFIKSHEMLDRKYYSGFLGATNAFDTKLFVNLRSGYYKDGMMTLYAGGGIMPESTIEQEWQETELKIQTMQQIVSKL